MTPQEALILWTAVGAFATYLAIQFLKWRKWIDKPIVIYMATVVGGVITQATQIVAQNAQITWPALAATLATALMSIGIHEGIKTARDQTLTLPLGTGDGNLPVTGGTMGTGVTDELPHIRSGG